VHIARSPHLTLVKHTSWGRKYPVRRSNTGWASSTSISQVADQEVQDLLDQAEQEIRSQEHACTSLNVRIQHEVN